MLSLGVLGGLALVIVVANVVSSGGTSPCDETERNLLTSQMCSANWRASQETLFVNVLGIGLVLWGCALAVGALAVVAWRRMRRSESSEAL
jgi:hypothetical protein